MTDHQDSPDALSLVVVALQGGHLSSVAGTRVVHHQSLVVAVLQRAQRVPIVLIGKLVAKLRDLVRRSVQLGGIVQLERDGIENADDLIQAG